MPPDRWPAVGRDALVKTLAASVRGEGAALQLVHGAWGTGTSRVLVEVANELTRSRRRVRHLVADGHLAATAIERAAGGAVVLIDDAHRLGWEAAEVVRELVLSRSMRGVVAVRQGAPLADPLEWLDTAGLAPRTEVLPLSADEVQRLLELRLGEQVHRGTTQVLADLSGGRPAFVVDLVDQAVENGDLVCRNGLWRLSGRRPSTTLVERRLARELRSVEPDVAAAHASLSLAGPVHPEVASAVAGDDAVATLFRLGHLALDPEGEVQVVPPIAATAARAALPPGSAAEAARRLIAVAGDRVRAEHRVRWARLASEAVPAELIGAAARATWRAGNPCAALDLIEPVAERPELGLLAAELLQELGDRARAVEILAAVEAAQAAPEPMRVAAALERATILLWDLDEASAAVATVGALLDEAPAPARPAVQAAYGAIRLFAGEPVEGAALLEPLVCHPDHGHEATAMLAAARALIGDSASAVELGRSACRRSPEADPPTATVALALALCEGGRLREAQVVVDTAYRRALEGTRSAQAWTALCRLRVALATGELEEAARAGLEAAELFSDLDQHATLRWATAGRIIAAASAGDAALAANLLGELDALGPSGVAFLEPDVGRARAWAAAASGDLPAARAEVAGAAELAEEMGALALAAAALHDLVRLGGDASGALADLAAATRSGWIRLRAVHAEAAVNSDAGALLEVSDRLADLGAAIPAAEAAAQALDASRASGRRRLERRARGALARRWARCPAARTPVLADRRAVVLTSRERQVAELAAAGASSRAIATDLGVSVRTVDNLLQRAYVKLGIHRRGDLAAVLASPRR